MTLETSPERALYAVTPAGPCRLPVRSEPGDGVHELAAGLPRGVYTALGTFEHDRFLGLDAHLDRLERNLEALGFGLPLDRRGLKAALDRLVRDYPLADARVRIDVLPEPPAGFDTDATVFITLAPHVPLPDEFLERGVGVGLTDRLKRERPLIKTTAFVAERRPLPLMTQECHEHVMVDAEGRLLECTSANFCGVRDGAVVTTPDGVLEGITRGLVYRLAAEQGIEVVHEAVRLSNYATLDEAFLTSSTRGVLPIVKIEDAPIGDGRPGPVTRRLRSALRELLEREARPAVER